MEATKLTAVTSSHVNQFLLFFHSGKENNKTTYYSRHIKHVYHFRKFILQDSTADKQHCTSSRKMKHRKSGRNYCKSTLVSLRHGVKRYFTYNYIFKYIQNLQQSRHPKIKKFSMTCENLNYVRQALKLSAWNKTFNRSIDCNNKSSNQYVWKML